jgi:hypothetical protein
MFRNLRILGWTEDPFWSHTLNPRTWLMTVVRSISFLWPCCLGCSFQSLTLSDGLPSVTRPQHLEGPYLQPAGVRQELAQGVSLTTQFCTWGLKSLRPESHKGGAWSQICVILMSVHVLSVVPAVTMWLMGTLESNQDFLWANWAVRWNKTLGGGVLHHRHTTGARMEKQADASQPWAVVMWPRAAFPATVLTCGPHVSLDGYSP